MQYPGPLRKMTGAPTQGTKRSRADETTQVANKAARLGSTTNGSITKSTHGANVNSQSGVQAIHQRNPQPHGLALGPDYGRVHTNGESLLPPRLDNDPRQPPMLNNNSGPIPTYQNVQHATSSGAQQYGATQSGPQQFGPQQLGPQHFAPHAQNGFYANTPAGVNPVQMSPQVNTTNHGGPSPQSGPNPQFAAQEGPQPQHTSPIPLLHDTRTLILYLRVYRS